MVGIVTIFGNVVSDIRKEVKTQVVLHILGFKDPVVETGPAFYNDVCLQSLEHDFDNGSDKYSGSDSRYCRSHKSFKCCAEGVSGKLIKRRAILFTHRLKDSNGAGSYG